MLQQTNKNNNTRLTKLQKAFQIKCDLKLVGYSQKEIAQDLNISPACVCRVINGHAKSKRVENWLKENLGV